MGASVCPYKEKCCMRSDKNICKALQDVNFEDGKCHFRKESKYGPNLYDAEKNRRVR